MRKHADDNRVFPHADDINSGIAFISIGML